MRTLLSTGFVIFACICPLVKPQLPGPSTSSNTHSSTPGPTTPVVTTPEVNEAENTSVEPHEPESATETPSSNNEASPSLPEAEVPHTPPPRVDNEAESDNIHNVTSTSSPHTATPSANEGGEEVTETTLSPTPGTTVSSVLTTELITTTPDENLHETSPAVPEEPITTTSSTSPATTQQEDALTTTDAPLAVTESSTHSVVEISTEGSEIPASSEPPVTITVQETSTIATTEEAEGPTQEPEGTTQTSPSTTLPPATTTVGGDNSSKTGDTTESTEGSAETVTTTTPETTKTSESAENSMGGCLSKADVNTILIIAIVVGVNVLSVVVTAICVHRLVSRRLSWDPPPMHYSKKKPAGGHPLAAPRTAGINLATDTECRAGENPATQIPIVITNEDGWCVPYSDQDKKKKNASEKKTEDTGV
ncbi:uncharacterized protein [Macrobrachium rosenbergii]|uniref:uncharacterized protein isoform X1 n=1 Tax=Macrobrachium rosenbergii TaxID=79674 RepID=UPI0034D544D7